MKVSEDFEAIREQLHRQMLSAVSHDLKTPLATIIGSLEICDRMDEALSREKRMTLVKSALGEAYRLDNFITNILDMAKLESGMVTATREQFSLKNSIRDCITKLGPKRSKCAITIDAVANPDAVVYGDPMLVGRAIGLVLENAVKHGGAGDTPAIHVQYESDATGFRVRVRDFGPGIPPGKEETIFHKYSRFAKGDHHNAGTGLGLAICRQLMTMQGGTVEAENMAEGGALFTLSFPSRR